MGVLKGVLENMCPTASMESGSRLCPVMLYHNSCSFNVLEASAHVVYVGKTPYFTEHDLSMTAVIIAMVCVWQAPAL